MNIKPVTRDFAITAQLKPGDLKQAAQKGFRSIICNRPDGEAADQPCSDVMAKAAQEAGLGFAYIPVSPKGATAAQADEMRGALAHLSPPVLAYCRSGARSGAIHALAIQRDESSRGGITRNFNIAIVGGGSAGIATAASILKRNRKISLAIIEPSNDHYYQPGWTMVGGGVFSKEFTKRDESRLIPDGANWIQSSVATFEPDENKVTLSDGARIGYDLLIICPGIKLDWGAIKGLPETLGKNGVTSNYSYNLAPYTNRLVKDMAKGRALFTQPPMPIKCAGAPQKAMYLSCSRWERNHVLQDIDVQFHTAGGVLFGVDAYVPTLMQYIKRYNAHLNFISNLIAIDGERKIATFEQKDGDNIRHIEERFDMIHVVPPQTAPDVIRSSPLAGETGFVAVDQATLQHIEYANIFSLGDACSAPNAKTAAAVRKQAPVVAVNALSVLNGGEPVAEYDGYGSCPLTVERGKIVLAEFGYGGKLLPSFPNWLIDGTRPSRLSWLLKDTILPPVYWHGMLKGHEWMVKPKIKRAV
ncbi:MAG: TIGR01244 family phosphatase [Sphingomonadales bacterium]|nr:TIGR01244 family phosphatase [Sphingomonadales bacterium]